MTLDEIQHRVAALERAVTAVQRRAATVVEVAATDPQRRDSEHPAAFAHRSMTVR